MRKLFRHLLIPVLLGLVIAGSAAAVDNVAVGSVSSASGMTVASGDDDDTDNSDWD